MSGRALLQPSVGRGRMGRMRFGAKPGAMHLGPTGMAIIAVVLVLAALAGAQASPLLFFAVVGILGAALFLIAPALGLAALPLIAIFAPVDFQASEVVRVNVVVLAIPVFAGLWLLSRLRQRRFSLVRTPLNLPLLAFLAAITLAWLLGDLQWDPFVAKPANVLQVQFGQWAIYAFSLAAAWLAANLLVEERWLRLTTYSFLAIGGVAVLIRTLPGLGDLSERMLVTGSMTSLFGVWFAAIALGQLLFNRRLPAPASLFLIAALIALFYLLLSISGVQWISGWAPVVVVVVVLLFLRFPRFTLLLLLVAALAIWLNPRSVMTGLQLDQEIARSGTGRLAHWRIVWEFVHQRLWFGLGLAAYRHYTWAHPELVAYYLFRGANVSTHNNYYDIFAFSGVVGLSAFLWFAAVFGRLAWRLARRFRRAAGSIAFAFDSAYAHGVLAGFIGMLVSGMLGDWFLPFVYNVGFPGFRASVMGWVLMGGLAALAVRMESSSHG